jgi:ribonucleotide reductase beta subunit family protein with ferritin-like domain
MNKFLDFANNNAKALNVLIGAAGTVVIAGVYVYAGYKLVEDLSAKKQMKQMLSDLEAIALDAQAKIDANRAAKEAAAEDAEQ